MPGVKGGVQHDLGKEVECGRELSLRRLERYRARLGPDPDEWAADAEFFDRVGELIAGLARRYPRASSAT